MKISTTQQQVNTKKFDDNFDKIFGGGKKTKGSYIQDPETGKLVPRNEYVRKETNAAPTVQGDIEAFVSPIDRSVISDRGQLRRHMREHGVTNSHDYSSSFIENKQKSNSRAQEKASRADRIDTIQRAIAHHERK